VHKLISPLYGVWEDTMFTFSFLFFVQSQFSLLGLHQSTWNLTGGDTQRMAKLWPFFLFWGVNALVCYNFTTKTTCMAWLLVQIFKRVRCLIIKYSYSTYLYLYTSSSSSSSCGISCDGLSYCSYFHTNTNIRIVAIIQPNTHMKRIFGTSL